MCKNFFMHMQDISSKTFLTITKKNQILLTQMIEVDMRIVHTLNEDVRHYVKQHILSFPAVRLPLLQGTYAEEVFSVSPNTASMCRMYKDWYTTNGKEAEKRECTKSIFHSELNIGFFQRTKDQGDLCKPFRNLSNKVVVDNLYNLSGFPDGCALVDGLLLGFCAV